MLHNPLSAQQIVDVLPIEELPKGQKHNFKLVIASNGVGEPLTIPVMVARGMENGPVFGITSAIHGNELNGIAVIHGVFDLLDPSIMKGTVIAFPVLNPTAYALNQREEAGGLDLNRIFPGSPTGETGQQIAWNIKTKVLPQLDYLADMHTASFGNVNTYYVRADLNDTVLKEMAFLQGAEIVLDNAGVPSAGTASSTKTMRAEAIEMGVKAITLEYGDPQIFQESMVDKGIVGISNLISMLEIQDLGLADFKETPVVCNKSYWLYSDEGGILEVQVSLGQMLEKGQPIAVLKNIYGQNIKTYFTPEAGVVIGKNTNPAAPSGSRILHLGIIRK